MPPDNGAYMIAAYVVTAVVLVGYALSLMVRLFSEKKKIKSPDGGTDG
ncbi:MAG: hypothetical protein ACE5FJ_10520 [Gemmatimonadales bacterium]